MRQTVAVLGAGNMGTALAQVIAGNGHAVRAWSIETDVLEEMRDARLNTKYLAGIDLHPAIEATWEISSRPATGVDISFSRSTTAATPRSMPRFRDMGLAPAVTFFSPSATMAWASTVAVVVPSPAISLVLVATSLAS